MKSTVKLLSLLLLPLGVQAQVQHNGVMITEAAAAQINAHEELLIPNAFTPNNDGQNDIFKIVNISTQKLIDFKIFNRWGTVLFRTTDGRTGWDGSYKNQPQPFGVYGYVIRIAYEDGYVETYKGTVTLIR